MYLSQYIVHRKAGDAATLAPQEKRFGITKHWVQQEVRSEGEGILGEQGMGLCLLFCAHCKALYRDPAC